MTGRIPRIKKQEPNFAWFVAVSLALHSLAMFGVGMGSGRSARAGLNLPSVYVQLYQPQEFPGFMGAGAGAISAGASVPASGKKAKGERPGPVSSSKEEKIVLPKEPTKEEVPKSSSSVSSSGLTEEDKKRVSDAISAIRREIAWGEGQGAEAEWQGIIAGINADLEKRSYYQRVVEVYRENWILPRTVPKDQNLRVRVVVRIEKGGRVMDYQVLSWSNNQALDRSVSKLLEMVKELPAPPLSLGAQWFSLGIEFRPISEE